MVKEIICAKNNNKITACSILIFLLRGGGAFLYLFISLAYLFRMSIFCYQPQEADTCIGCMQKESDIKLVKLCDSTGVEQCVQCYCRPMWCLECMGKWFASRQDQQRPEVWMSGSSPCPTCRAKFCVLDVCKLVK